MKCLSGCLALLGLTVSCNDELYMGGVGVVPATKAYYLYTNMLGFNLPDTVVNPSTFNVECQNVPWRLDVADEWLKVTPAEGNGEEDTTLVSVGGGHQSLYVLPHVGVQPGGGHGHVGL